MNKHLDNYLCKKYPKIFADRNKPMTETCMCWGFETGNGWYFLIDTLCSSIQHHCEHIPYVYKKTPRVYAIRAWNWVINTFHLPWKWSIGGELYEEGKPIPQVVANQVKEKFGGLRFYCHGGDDVTRGMINLAESLSYQICEECGKMNEWVNPNARGWIQTTCADCARDKENHLANQDKALIAVWEQVKEDRLNAASE